MHQKQNKKKNEYRAKKYCIIIDIDINNLCNDKDGRKQAKRKLLYILIAIKKNYYV